MASTIYVNKSGNLVVVPELVTDWLGTAAEAQLSPEAKAIILGLRDMWNLNVETLKAGAGA